MECEAKWGEEKRNEMSSREATEFLCHSKDSPGYYGWRGISYA
jgi:hypothetical protein